MTLAQNLRQLLNGSSLLLPALIGLSLLTSCDAFKKAQSTPSGEVTEERDELDEVTGDQVYNPKTGRYEHSTSVNQEMDTVKWTVVLPEENPPISSEATLERDDSPIGIPGGITDKPDTGISEKLSVYNVSLLLPFYSQRFGDGTTISRNALPAINFYGGAKIAFDELSSEGINLSVDVHDTKASGSVVEELMGSNELRESHLIVGPFIKDNIKVAASAVKNLRTPLVSPLSPSSNVTADNPYFIQVSPYLQTHCEMITQHARKRYRTDQLVLVVRNKPAEISRMRYFQAENNNINGSEIERIKEFIITDQSADLSEMDITPYILEGDTTVFIVPSWSNESFVYSLLRNIQVARGKNPVVVYGMPQWMRYERISYDYYEQLNLHVSSATYINQDDRNVQDFRRKYYERFGTTPTDEAFIGYDVMLYFGRMLAQHGTRFQERLDAEMSDYLHTKFHFTREVPLSAALEEDFSKTNLYENKYVNILRFADYYFQLAN